MSAVTTQSDRQNCHQTMEECGASVIKEDKQEKRQDCSHCEQGEGEDKTGSLSPSFQGEVQLTREFAQLEGMSSLLGIGHLTEHPVNHLKNTNAAESFYCQAAEDEDYGFGSSIKSLPPVPLELEHYKSSFFQGDSLP